MWSIYTREYYSATGKNKDLKENLEIIFPTELLYGGTESIGGMETHPKQNDPSAASMPVN